MSFVQTATNKTSIVGLGIAGAGLAVGFLGTTHIVLGGLAISVIGYLVTLIKHSTAPMPIA